MKVLVTGGAGFIGSHIVEKFVEKGHEVVVVDNLSSGTLDNIKGLSNVKFYKQDIRDKNLIDIFKMEKPDIVYNEAAQISVGYSIKDPYNDADINIMGLVNVLECCVKTNVKKFITASSAAVYGVPKSSVSYETDELQALSFYGLTKMTSEKYVRLYHDLFNLQYVILRYSNVFGPRQSCLGEAGVVAIFSDAMKNNKDIYIDGDGEQTRDFIYVKDVANANYLVGVENVKNETFNVSNNGKTSINELFSAMKKAFSYKKDAIHREKRLGDIRDSRLSNDLLKSKTSFETHYDIQSGLNEYAGSLGCI